MRDEAESFMAIGYAYLRIGNHRAATEAFAQARRQSESISDGVLTADIVNAQGVALIVGRHAPTLAVLGDAEDLARGRGLFCSRRPRGSMILLMEMNSGHKGSERW